MILTRFQDDVSFVEHLIRGWLGNIARDAIAQDAAIAPEAVAQALANILEEYDAQFDAHEFDEWLRNLTED